MERWRLKPEHVARIRKHYPPGTRVTMLYLSNPFYDIPEHTQGTVERVGDDGTIYVNWDNGERLGMDFLKDIFDFVDKAGIGDGRSDDN